jgi:hypothetical protein
VIAFTIWFSYYFGKTYEPLTKYIALRSLDRENGPESEEGDTRAGIRRRNSTTVDEARERGQRFVNPSLVVP